MRSTSTDPTMPRQPINPTRLIAATRSLVALQRMHYSLPPGEKSMSESAAAEIILPREAEWSPGFDVARASDAYVATIPPAERAKSDAYFEGGYWIGAWGTLITVLIAWLLLTTRFSARLRDLTERRARRPFLQACLYAAGFLLALSLLTLPWTLYTSFFREHQYGMTNQALGGFLGEWLISLALGLVFGSLAIAGLYAIVRRVRERWVLWATGATAVFMLFVNLVYPLFLAPLFNDYQPLPDGEVRRSILALAEETGVPADDVWWFDASRQTKRISANVAGFAGTIRIALNDNLLNGTTLPEIRAAMAHEMCHYVLNHWLWLPLIIVLTLGFGYWIVDRVFAVIQRRHGERWGVRDLADPAGLPLALAIFSAVMLLLTPLSNNITRIAEHQADAFGLDAAREPHGFASVAMRLAPYRKIEPSPLEELIFFDHPSGRTRVERAMTWLAEHPPTTP
jgi:STE24 endopeptidase